VPPSTAAQADASKADASKADASKSNASKANASPLVACHLGPMPYRPAWDLQKRVQGRLIASKRSTPRGTPAEASVPDVVLTVEHPHVYTLGKSGDAAHLLLSEERLAEVGATFVPIDRGGDITYHGPGQLVAYPILDLHRHVTDLGRYLRLLEEAVIRTCAAWGVEGGRVEGRTGVWIGPDARGPERKICAMGVRCSRWVTMHGLAFNLNTDLAYFGHIVPCGIADRGVTSLAKETGAPVDEDAARTRLLAHLADLLDTPLDTREGDAARAFLAAYTGTPLVTGA
jgi:lipoyl(octanoyl) transferase